MTPKLHKRILKLSAGISPDLHSHIKRLGPLQLPNRKHLGIAKFLARVIIGQQLSTKAAHTIWSRIQLAARESNRGIPHFFIDDNVATLRACGASGNKAKALLAINEARQDGRLAPARLRRLDAEERAHVLRELHGVGQWTIDVASMFYFGDTDVWPSGDLTVARQFAGFLTTKQAAKTEDLLAQFSPYRSYLALYMWAIADATVVD